MLQGPHVGPGYTDPRRNQGMFRADGWLISGDLGHLDEGTHLHHRPRQGPYHPRRHNIDPAMIEELAAEHPAVQMAAAVGEPDAYAGELPMLFVTLKPGAAASESDFSISWRRASTSARRAEARGIVDAMPVTAVGKIYKPALRRLATERRLAEVLAPLAEGGVEAPRRRRRAGRHDLAPHPRLRRSGPRASRSRHREAAARLRGGAGNRVGMIGTRGKIVRVRGVGLMPYNKENHCRSCP